MTFVAVNLTLLPEASFPFPSSSTWNRRFSKRITEPSAGLAQVDSTSEPTQSFRNMTSLEVSQDLDSIFEAENIL